MASFRVARQALSIAAWRKPNCGIARFVPHLTSVLQIQGHSLAVRYQRFTSTPKTASATKKETMDENLLKMDIDAAEKHMKEWFGDHASWSHEQLLNLAYGTTSLRILHTHTDS